MTIQKLEKIYDEAERRLHIDIDLMRSQKINVCSADVMRYIRAYMQGVYGTIKVMVSKEEWRDIVPMLDDIEHKRKWSCFETWR